MAILGDYVNGNHRTILYDDGTRFRETGSYVEGKWVADDADHFTFEFPESFDLKVTDRCDGGCQFCHEDSTVNGKHGDLSKLAHIVETIRPGTEIAVGGGDLFTCPGIDDFLALLKRRGIIANITVSQRHLGRYGGKLQHLVQEKTGPRHRHLPC